MVAFATDHEPGTPTVEPKNRVGDFFVDIPGCIGIDGPQTRTVAGENDRFSYDACRSISLDQGGQKENYDYIIAADISKNPESWDPAKVAQISASDVNALQALIDSNPEWGRGLVVGYETVDQLGAIIGAHHAAGVRDFTVFAHGVTTGSMDGFWIDGAPNTLMSARSLIEAVSGMPEGTLSGLRHLGCNTRQGSINFEQVKANLAGMRSVKARALPMPAIDLGI